ncbi:MAG TPA: TetR/AcrR family transcriptional regulator [Gaiellaceae bacterium]|nr:TetR/AcrR family transcriptional regulator [Gaiellaceae bacterium]
MSVTGTGGRELKAKGLETRRRLLDAAERVFGEHGFYDASIVKITEAAGVAQGTFYLYFASKQEIFEELVRDLNARVRHAMQESAAQGADRIEAERLGFRAYFRFTADHPAIYRIIRQAEFVSPEALRYHYDKITEGYVVGLRQAIGAGEIADVDPEVAAWALMAMGEMLGMRWLLWEGREEMPQDVLNELDRLIVRVLEP